MSRAVSWAATAQLGEGVKASREEGREEVCTGGAGQLRAVKRAVESREEGLVWEAWVSWICLNRGVHRRATRGKKLAERSWAVAAQQWRENWAAQASSILSNFRSS